MIEAKHLCYQLGRRKLLDNLSFSIGAGERWMLYGMNGCGKTTLLSILAGFQQQTAGSLQVFGDAYTAQNILAKRRQIGFVSSSFFDSRYRHERVLDIVLAGKDGTYGLEWGRDAESHCHAMALLARFGIVDKAYDSYARLSKGQRQNVLLARAFMGEPEILLLDEPCSGLDVLAKNRFLSSLEQLLLEKPLTVLFVTHDFNEAKDMFPKALFLRNGRLFAQGDTAIMFNDHFLSEFFQEPVTLTTATVQHITAAGGENTLFANH